MKLAFAACVLLVAVLSHAPAPLGTYTFDDHSVIEGNPRLVVKSAGDLVRLAGSNYWGDSAQRTGERLFRPLPLLSYAAERALVGAPDARIARSVNVALHALAALAALALFASVVEDDRAALVGALVFAAHPLHAEAVAGVVGRAEVLALLFGLLALHAAGKGSLLAGPLLVLALASKESALAVIPIALARDLLERRRRFAALASLVLALAVYIALRAWAIGDLVPKATARTLGDKDLWERLPYTLAVYRDAWRDTLMPFAPTAAHYPLPRTGPAALAGAGLVQLACLLAVAMLARGGPRSRGIALGIVGFELALLPVSNLIPIGVVYAERLLYAPTAWAALALGAAVGPLVRGPATRLTLALAIGGLSFLSVKNDLAWRDDAAIWKASVARFPDQPRSLAALGEVELQKGELPAAIAHLGSAVALFPDTQPLKAKTCALLGAALAKKDRARSDAAFERALRLAPGSAEVWLRLAQTRYDEDDGKGALTAAERACELDPGSAAAFLILGLARLNGGDPRAAIACFDKALANGLPAGEGLVNRAEARWVLGDRAAALDDYRAAVDLLPGDTFKWRLVARLAEAGRRDEARERWSALRDRAPLPVRDRIDEMLRP